MRGRPVGYREPVDMSEDDQVLAARAAYRRGDWRSAYDGFGRAHNSAELNTDDLSSYGMAAWRLGYGRESIQLCEQAFNRLLAEGDQQYAAMKAVEAVAAGWCGCSPTAGPWCRSARPSRSR